MRIIRKSNKYFKKVWCDGDVDYFKVDIFLSDKILVDGYYYRVMAGGRVRHLGAGSFIENSWIDSRYEILPSKSIDYKIIKDRYRRRFI